MHNKRALDRRLCRGRAAARLPSQQWRGLHLAAMLETPGKQGNNAPHEPHLDGISRIWGCAHVNKLSSPPLARPPSLPVPLRLEPPACPLFLASFGVTHEPRTFARETLHAYPAWLLHNASGASSGRRPLIDQISRKMTGQSDDTFADDTLSALSFLEQRKFLRPFLHFLMVLHSKLREEQITFLITSLILRNVFKYNNTKDTELNSFDGRGKIQIILLSVIAGLGQTAVPLCTR